MGTGGHQRMAVCQKINASEYLYCDNYNASKFARFLGPNPLMTRCHEKLREQPAPAN